MAKSNKRTKAVAIDSDNERLIVIAAFRYYLGRQTISVWSFGRWLENVWPSLCQGTRDIIQRELEEAFKRDAEDREQFIAGKTSFKIFALGSDCDRRTWAGVRRLYRTPRCCFCGQEMDESKPGTFHQDGEYSCASCAPLECEVCSKPFKTGEQIIPNQETRRSRHPGCRPIERGVR